MWIWRSFKSFGTEISLKSWATLKWVVCSCRRHFDGSFQSHNINLSSAACLWILLVEDTEPIDFSPIKRERSKCLSGKKESFNFEWPLIVYVESTILMKQKPESTFNLQVIKKRTSHPSIDLRCDVLFSLSAHFYWVVWLFALTVHLLALLFSFSLSLYPFLLASENQIFIYSSHELNSEKNHSLHCFELWGKKSHEWSCFIGNWFLTLPLVSTLMKNVSFRTSRKMWNRTFQWTPGAKSLNN